MGLCSTALVIGLHAVSYHTDTAAGYNNTNPGIYASYDGYAVGTYYNSIRRQTFYAGKVYELTDSCRYEATVGLATGYKFAVIPFVVGSVKFDTHEIIDGTVTRISVMPTARDRSVNGVVFHLSLEKAF